MAKQRKNKTAESERPDRADRAVVSWQARLGPGATAGLTAGFLIGLAIYLVLFYRVEYGEDVYRYQLLGYLLVPDELFALWCGEAFGEFSILDRLPVFGVALCIWVAALALGSLVLGALGADRYLDRLESFIFAVGLGLGGLSLITLVVGLFGGLRQPHWLGILGLFLIAGSAFVLWRRNAARASSGREVDRGALRSRSGGVRAREFASRWFRWRWWWFAVPFAAAIMLGAALPPIDFDVKEYHLQVPKEWYQAGRISFLPHNVYGNMPLGAENLATLAMAVMPGTLSWWWGALAGKVVMAGYALLTALLLFTAGRRFFSVQAGIVASLLYVSTAWIALVSVNGLNEGAVAFYLFASAYAARLWVDRPARDGAEFWGLLGLTGLMVGSAVACKYTSILFVVIPVGLVVLWNVRSRRGARYVQVAVVFALAVMVVCGTWLGKNWVFTGNPTYPLLVGTLGGATRTPEKDAQWRQAHRVPRDSQGRSYTAAQAWQSALQVLGRSRWHNPLLVPLALLLILRREKLRETAFWITGFVVVIALWWVFTHRVDRFWVPALPLMALLAGVGATWSNSAVWRRVLWSVMVLGLSANFIVVASPLIGDNRYFVKLQQLRDDPRLAQTSAAHRFLNDHVTGGNRVLLVGDAAVFDVRVPAIYNTCFDDCIFEQIFRDRSPAARRARLAELRITYIFVNWDEIARYREPGSYGFTDYVTRELVHDELEARQGLIRRVQVPGLDPEHGEVFEVNWWSQ